MHPFNPVSFFYSCLLNARPLQFGGKQGVDLAAHWEAAFAHHPSGYGMPVLRARCACLSGDGALTEGGPEHRHKSTRAAEIFWTQIHPRGPRCTTWDHFHRSDIAFWRGIKAIPLAVTCFDLAKELSYLFAWGDGAQLFRGVADAVGELGSSRIVCAGGTRKVSYISMAPGNLVSNYPKYVSGLWARIAWAQEGHGAHKIHHLLDVGQRLQSASVVVFATVLGDVLGARLAPFSRLCKGFWSRVS